MNTTTPFEPFQPVASSIHLEESSARSPSLMDDPRRRAILSDREIHGAIRWVIRVRGVPTFDVDEVLDSVIEDAMEDANLPLADRDQARMYLVACARNKSIDEARGRIRRNERDVSTEEEPLETEEALPQDRAALAARLFREGQSRFPRTFSWFWRHAIHGESLVSIAVEHNVSPGHVRHEVYRIRHTLNAFSTLVVAFAAWSLIHTWTLPHRERFERRHEVSKPCPVLVADDAPPAERAAELRERASERFAARDWDGVVADLDAARRIDPAGDTDAWKTLHERAETHRRELMSHPEPR
jgi:DNA-directed RNA polymerase specialized sigma24 family protein